LNGTKDASHRQAKSLAAAATQSVSAWGKSFPLDFRRSGFHNGNRLVAAKRIDQTIMSEVSRTKRKPRAGTIGAGIPKEVRIGARLKHPRMVRGLTLKEVADAADCSESFISKLENNKASPSFTMLHRLMAILGVNVASLFAAGEEVDSVVSHPGARPVILTDRLRVGKGIKLERLIPYSHSYLLQGNIHHIATGGRSDGNIVHSGEEVGYVLEGEIELTVDRHRYRVKAGDSFHFRSELPHGYRNVGAKPARVIWINTPPTF
jgi:transcriptional regulator with XRE-family HTH domain